jgi:uncharacterized protein (TIGR04255 family)
MAGGLTNEFARLPLPDFDNPPVVETVLSVQFDKIPAMQGVHFGLYWREIKSRFPIAEELHALPRVIEQFRELPHSGARIRFEALETPSIPRLLLRNEVGTEIIQVQNDRFTKNWRKSGEKDQYPHYDPVIKPAFVRDFLGFQAFLTQEGLGTVKVNQCEVTCVNHIVAGEGWHEFSEVDRFSRSGNSLNPLFPVSPKIWACMSAFR